MRVTVHVSFTAEDRTVIANLGGKDDPATPAELQQFAAAAVRRELDRIHAMTDVYPV
jgi:hypothetical protein